MANEWSNKFSLTPEFALKLCALVLALGLLIGKLNGIDDRLARIERFLDQNVVIEVKGKP